MSSDEVSIMSGDESVDKIILAAAMNCDWDAVEVLLKEGANVNARSSRNFTLMHYCAQSCSDPEFLLLLVQKYGADINVRNLYGQTPLVCRCKALVEGFGDLEFVIKMLEYGAEVDPSILINIYCDQKEPLCNETGNANSVALLRLLLDHGADVDAHTNEACDDSGTPLGFLQSVDEMRVLLEYGADIEYQISVGADTPLLSAIQYHDLERAEFFLDHGASLSAKKRLTTPLHRAVHQESEGIVEALFRAQRARGEDLSHILLARNPSGLSLTFRFNRTGLSPFHEAVTYSLTKEYLRPSRPERFRRFQDFAQLLLEQKLDNGSISHLCHAMMFDETDGETAASKILAIRTKVDDYEAVKVMKHIVYLESFLRQPLTVLPDGCEEPRHKISKTTASPSYELAVRPNPSLNNFQRKAANEFWNHIYKWKAPGGDTGSFLPDSIKMSIMGYLSPMDVLKRSPPDLLD
jgi:ankyrin repeat protein